jgi:ASPIC and UnbV
VQWVDFDGNGALDLALANNNPNGGHYLFRNTMPSDRARRSIQVMVLDERGRYTHAGSEVRVYAAGTRKVLGGRIVDTGGGYCSQSVMPVHVGLPSEGKVDVEVTAMTKSGRRITRVANVDPNKLPKRVLTVKVGATPQRSQ